MKKEQERAKLIAKRYPILEAVEPEKRRDYVRKAVMHPIIIIFALLLAGFILPKGLEIAMNQLGLAGGIVDIETALKFCLMVGIPFFFIYIFLNKLLMPFCIKRVLKKMDILTQKNKKLPFTKVAVGIIWREDKFLAARRPDDGPRGGFWEFPGGKNEEGENMRETLYRELKEELGIECIEIEEFRVFDYKYPDLHVELHFMNVLSFKNEPVPKIGQRLKWLNSEEAKELNFLAADLNVLDILEQP